MLGFQRQTPAWHSMYLLARMPCYMARNSACSSIPLQPDMAKRSWDRTASTSHGYQQRLAECPATCGQMHRLGKLWQRAFLVDLYQNPPCPLLRCAAGVGRRKPGGTSETCDQRLASEQLEKRGPSTPYINSFCLVALRQDLRCHEVKCACKGTRRPAQLRCPSAPTKIYNLQFAVRPEQQVLWFDISVDNAKRVDILESTEQLTHPSSGLSLHNLATRLLQSVVLQRHTTELHAKKHATTLFDAI